MDNSMRITVSNQTKIEEALSLEQYNIQEDERDSFIYNATQQILYDFFAYYLITRGTGICLAIEELDDSILFTFQETLFGCVSPNGFINQICSSKWGDIYRRYLNFQTYLNQQGDDIFGISIFYKKIGEKKILTKANLLKRTKAK
jgi:hypothetical protein